MAELDLFEDLSLNDENVPPVNAPVRNKKMTIDDFDCIRVIGRGAFGEVRVVRKKDDRQVYALKIMKKTEMLEQQQVAHTRAERYVRIIHMPMQ